MFTFPIVTVQFLGIVFVLSIPASLLSRFLANLAMNQVDFDWEGFKSTVWETIAGILLFWTLFIPSVILYNRFVIGVWVLPW